MEKDYKLAGNHKSSLSSGNEGGKAVVIGTMFQGGR